MDNAARGWRDPQVRRAATTLLILTLGASPAAWAEKAYFAGGCFWCMESDFEGLPGVEDVISGFTGGTAKSPTYTGDHTGHYEAVEITYDPSIVSYQDLLDHYWVNIDPFDATGSSVTKARAIAPRYSCRRRRRADWRSNRSKMSRRRFRTSGWSRRFSMPAPSIPSRATKVITRTTTRRALCDTGSIGSTAAAMRA